MASRIAPVDGIGDINLDGYVDDADILLLKQFIVGILTPTDEQYRRADTNGDGTLNALDITTMELYMYSVIDTFPASLKEAKPGRLGWDLPSSLPYTPGTDLPATIHVTNMTYYEQEFALMSRLIDAAGVVLSDEAVKLEEKAWFMIDGIETKVILGRFNFPQTNVTLVLSLCDKESGTTIDSVQTSLVSPSAASAWPATWPVAAGTVTQSGADWTSMLTSMMSPMMVFMMMAVVMSTMRRT